MDRAAVRAAFDSQLRQHVGAAEPDARVERAGRVVRQTSPRGDGWTGVLWSDLGPGTADAAIAEQVRYFASSGREFEWKLYSHDRPADLAERLRAAGFTAGPPETLMVAEAAALAVDHAPPEGVELRTVTGRAEVDMAVEVHERAFGTDGSALRSLLLAQLADSSGRFHALLAVADGVPVSAARLEFYPGTDFAGLWSGGTVPGRRGGGLYRALTASRARTAAAHGYRYLQVDASDESRPILERLGFVALGTTTPWLHPATSGRPV